jgi:hypothetical protein
VAALNPEPEPDWEPGDPLYNVNSVSCPRRMISLAGDAEGVWNDRIRHISRCEEPITETYDSGTFWLACYSCLVLWAGGLDDISPTCWSCGETVWNKEEKKAVQFSRS